MVIPDITTGVQAVTFVVGIVILNKLIIGPIREIISKRKALMDEQMDKIDGFNAKAATKVEDYEAQLTAARKEGAEIRNQMKDQGTAEEHKMMSVAGEEAGATIKAAQAEIKSQVAVAMGQLAKDVDAFAAAATDKILGQA